MLAVSRTAIGVARVRAAESRRPDRLFDDPFAQRFAALAAPVDVGPPSPARLALALQVIVRTRFYDDWLAEQVRAGVRQVVLLGAGLDARAYRLDWPAGTVLFEVDLPAVLAAKHDLLAGEQPRCERHAVAADVTGEFVEALTAAGFDAAAATAWLVEGLLVYLDRDQATHVLRRLSAVSAPGSVVATELTSGSADRLTAPDTAATTSLWQGGLGADAAGLLREHGWSPRSHLLTDVAAGFGRPMSRASESGFVTAGR